MHGPLEEQVAGWGGAVHEVREVGRDRGGPFEPGRKRRLGFLHRKGFGEV